MNPLKHIQLFAFCLVATPILAAPPSPGVSVLVSDTPPAAMTTATNAALPPLSDESFIQSAFGYFSSFNTNLGGALGPFSTNSPYEVWIGAAYQSGVNLGAQIGAEGQPFAKMPGLTIGEVSTFAPQVGTIADEELDVGWSIEHIDTRLFVGGAVAYAFGNASEEAKGIKGGLVAEVQKALSKNTFAGTRFEALFGNGTANDLIVCLEAGTTF